MGRQIAMDLGRRRFLDLLLAIPGLAAAGLTGTGIFRYLTGAGPEEAPTIGGELVLGPIEGFPETDFKIVSFGGRPVIVVRAAGGRFIAFTATCTHLQCTVGYSKEVGAITCACHGGRYDLTGRPIAGPPPRPLTPLRVVARGRVLVLQEA